MGFEEEVTAMNAYSEPPGTDAPGTTAPGTTAPGTMAPGTSAPATDAPATDAPSTSAPATSAPTTDAPKDELTLLREELAETKRMIEEMKRKPATKAPSTSAPTTDAPKVFVADEDELDDVTRSPEKFNQLLNKVFQEGVKAARAAGQPITREQLIQQSAQTVVEMTEANRLFYEANKDLLPHRKDVAAVYGEVASANPTHTLGQLLDTTAKEVRRRKNLPEPKPTNDTANKDKKPPNLPPGSKGKRTQGQPQTKQTKLEAEIAAMNSTED